MPAQRQEFAWCRAKRHTQKKEVREYLHYSNFHHKELSNADSEADHSVPDRLSTFILALRNLSARIFLKISSHK